MLAFFRCWLAYGLLGCAFGGDFIRMEMRMVPRDTSIMGRGGRDRFEQPGRNQLVRRFGRSRAVEFEFSPPVWLQVECDCPGFGELAVVLD